MKTLLFLFSILVAAGSASAQYQIASPELTGGGGLSTSSVYVAHSSIGNSIAGRQTGGPYSLQSGVWGIVAVVPEAGAPVLRIIPTPTRLLLVWPHPSVGFQLQETSSLGTPVWSDVRATVNAVGSENQVSLPWQRNERFFRLRKP